MSTGLNLKMGVPLFLMQSQKNINASTVDIFKISDSEEWVTRSPTVKNHYFTVARKRSNHEVRHLRAYDT